MSPTFSRSGASADSTPATRVAEIVERLQAGDRIDLKQFCADAPEMLEELEILLPTLEAVAELERSSGIASTSNTLTDSLGGTLGDFRIAGELGRGGMGIVYEAEQISLSRRVALKVLPLAATLSPQQLQRFKNEARAAATLRHPHIVGVYSVGVERGVHYYAMELVQGQSLAQLLGQLRGAANNPLPHDQETVSPTRDTAVVAAFTTQHSQQPQEYFREVVRLMADAAEALDYAHSQGVVHRDIKPANILIDEQSHVWVTDFGLAQLEADAGVTLTGDILGTLKYMSPEQASGKPAVVDFRTDIHALGATLFELLSLRCPFEGNDRASLLRQVAEQSPPRLSQIDPSIPRDLETIATKAMEKDPIDRYESAATMASDLRAFTEHRPISARPPSLAARTRKWTRRNPRFVAAGVLTLVFAVVGLVVSTLLINHQRSVALQNAETARMNAETASLNAKKADENFQLALTSLEQTLAESVAGNLVVQYNDPKHKELERRGIAFYQQLATRNNVDPQTWPTYGLLVCNQKLEKAFQLKFESSPEAEAVFLQAVSMADRLHADAKDNPRYLAKLIHCLDELSVYLHEIGRNDDADVPSQRAGILATQLLESHPEFLPANYLLGINHYNTGVRLQNTGLSAEAEKAYQQSLVHLDAAFRAEPNEVRNPYGLAQCKYNLAMNYATAGDATKATKYWKESLKLWKGLILMRPLRSEFHSRAGATLSNLAVLARQAEDYKACRKLAEEALTFQKHAIEIEPVYELAKQFMQKHYKELSLALSSLRDREALAAIAEERVTYLPDIADEYCNAAMSLGDCLNQLYHDSDYSDDDRQQLMGSYVRRAFELLNEASDICDGNNVVFIIGRAYLFFGEACVEVGRTDDAQRSWLMAECHFLRVQSDVNIHGRNEINEFLEFTRERIEMLTAE